MASAKSKAKGALIRAESNRFKGPTTMLIRNYIPPEEFLEAMARGGEAKQKARAATERNRADSEDQRYDSRGAA